MLSIDVLLGMVATEAIEHPREKPYLNQAYLPKFPELQLKYNLELIRQPDGTHRWVE